MYLTFASPDVTCTTDCLDTYGQSDFVPIYSLGLNFANGHVLTPHWSVHNVSDPFLVMELKYHIETIGRHISRVFKAIDAHPNSDRLRRVLRLAIYAVQPLTVYELAEGIATGEMINVWDPARIVTDSMSLINEQLFVCVPSSTFPHLPDVVIPFHASVKELLANPVGITQPLLRYALYPQSVVHYDLARLCFAYLKLRCEDEDIVLGKDSETPFAKYAAEGWVAHIRTSGSDVLGF